MYYSNSQENFIYLSRHWSGNPEKSRWEWYEDWEDQPVGTNYLPWTFQNIRAGRFQNKPGKIKV